MSTEITHSFTDIAEMLFYKVKGTNGYELGLQTQSHSATSPTGVF